MPNWLHPFSFVFIAIVVCVCVRENQHTTSQFNSIELAISVRCSLLWTCRLVWANFTFRANMQNGKIDGQRQAAQKKQNKQTKLAAANSFVAITIFAWCWCLRLFSVVFVLFLCNLVRDFCVCFVVLGIWAALLRWHACFF